VKDAWQELLAGVKGKVVNLDGEHFEERISTQELLTVHLQLSADRINDGTTKRLKAVMHRFGWQGAKKIKFGNVPLQGYWRPANGADAAKGLGSGGRSGSG
jgi:hypothetical protein